MFDVKIFRKRIIIFTLIYLVCISSLFLHHTYAKYVSNINHNAIVNVARPVIVYNGLNNGGLSFSLDEMNPTSEAKTYTFDIINEDDLSTTDVNLDYEVIISTTNNLPLNIYITCNDVTPTNSSIISTLTGVKMSTSFSGQFYHSIADTHTFTVVIEWQENVTNWQYANEVDQIDIIVNWVQQR